MDYNKVIDIVKQTKCIIMDMQIENTIIDKGVFDYVTTKDISVQEHIKNQLNHYYPTIDFISEESNNVFNKDKPTWILDPIDGTTNFIHHHPNFAISLALYNGKEVEFGIIYAPITNETYVAIKGKGAFLNEMKISVTNHQMINECLIAFGTSPYNKTYAEDNFDLFKRVFLECQDVRRTGSAALDIAYVAAGRFDVFFERDLKPWDYAAGIILLQEAGGKITNWENNELTLYKKNDVLATNMNMHKYMLKNFLITQNNDF